MTMAWFFRTVINLFKLENCIEQKVSFLSCPLLPPNTDRCHLHGNRLLAQDLHYDAGTYNVNVKLETKESCMQLGVE